MSLEKEFYQKLIKERLSILIGSTYDVEFYKVALKDSLEQDVEKLRDEKRDKEIEIGSLKQARAVAERSKGFLLPKELERLDKLTEEVFKLGGVVGGKGGKIDEIMEAQATIKALEEKRSNARKYYEFAKEKGIELLNSIKE